ncbi:MAG TPA: hypothetical protein PLU24_05425, partial [Candidatus Omnitrophota bacterium]|nr:hypothetical protein [Candidatus Omnitrophota bacterium]
ADLLAGYSLFGFYVLLHDAYPEQVAGWTAAIEGAIAELVGYYLARNKDEKVRTWISTVRFSSVMMFRYFILGYTASKVDHFIDFILPADGVNPASGTSILRALLSMIHGVVLSSVVNFLAPYLSFKMEAKCRRKEGKTEEARSLESKYTAKLQFKRVMDSVRMRVAPVVIQHDIIQNIFGYELAYKILSRFGLGFINSTFRSWVTNRSAKVADKYSLSFTLAVSLISLAWGTPALAVIAVGIEVSISLYKWQRNKMNREKIRSLDLEAGLDRQKFDRDYENYLKKNKSEEFSEKTPVALAEDIMRRRKDGNIFVVAQDGNSGAFKSTTAEKIASILREAGIKVVLISRDWFLRDRSEKYKDQDDLLEKEAYVLTDDQISLRREKFENEVLNKLQEFKLSDESALTLSLKELYNKWKDDGRCTREETLEIDRSTVVIIEGNYLLTKRWKKYFDYRILMLAKPSIGLDRRLDRDSHAPQDRVKKIFWRINTSSYMNYLKKYILKPNRIITTDSVKAGSSAKSLDFSSSPVTFFSMPKVNPR